MFATAPPSRVRFNGAVYRLALSVGSGALIMTGDDVAELLAAQFHNRGLVTVEKLKRRWVASPWFVLTEIYPALPEIGVTAGKTGRTYSAGQPLVIDLDLHSAAEHNSDGSLPRYLVLDGQNRLVKLRHEAPYRLYPAYVGLDILRDVERANEVLAYKLQQRKRHAPHVDEIL